LTKGDVYIGPDISLHQSNEMTVQVTKKDNPYYLLQKLTIQEKKIMELVIEGKSSTDIAQLLFRSVHTIKTHRKNMLHKLGVSNTIELISFLDSVDYNK
ncbi:MAG: helix-turn-helix transcriptional regulator, partial [Saprospiraceae bacterium]